MALIFIAKDPNTGGEDCPTVWVDAKTQEIVCQGWNASPELIEECLKTGHLPETESVIRLPFRLIPALRKALDVAERSTV